jgi:FAD/FMN-containing dehydrogenase/Fe-S oxidoreductase
MLESVAVDDQKFHRLEAGLRGEFHDDPIFRETFASAACLYRIPPRAVAIPKDDADISAVISFAGQEKVAITPRGAGSAVAGQALGSGIVINLTKYYNRILELNPETKRVMVEPGVIFADLNRALKPHGLFFPPDPSSGNYCTIGGMIANNSSGAHSLFYGPTQNYVEELEVILADGTRAILGLNKFQLVEEKSYWARTLRKKLDALLQENRLAVEKDRPQVKNASGYLIWGALAPEGTNYARLMVGSEGTIGVIVRAWLKVESIPKFKSAGLIYFKDLDSATQAVLKLRLKRPQAIEIMDRNFINIVRDNYPDLKPLLDDQAQFMLLCEFDGGSKEEALEKIRAANELAVEKEHLGYKSVVAQNSRELDMLWKVRQSASPILYRMGSGLVRFIEDIVIPPEKFPEGLAELQNIFAEFKTFAPVMGHAGEGNLHLNPSFNPADQGDRRRMQVFADRVYKMVIRLGGSISGEHGDGILRAPYVQTQFPNAFQTFKDLKNIFDPLEILNPGKILAEPGLIPTENIKYFQPKSIDSRLQQMFEEEESLELIFRCHGCGLCRSYCPGITGFESETALPRSKASIARGLAQGLLDESVLASPEMKTLLSACFSCQRCLNLCPTGVQVARFMEQIKNYSTQTGNLSLRNQVLERSGDLISLMGKMPDAALPLISSSLSKTALRLIGINPEAASFVKDKDIANIKKSKTARTGKIIKDNELKIIFFPGCLERWMEPEALEQTQKILDGLGADYILLSDLCCGMPSSQDNRELTLKAAEKFSSRVLPLINQGYLLLTNCPSCLSIFKHNYPVLLGEPGKKIAKAAISIFDLKEKLSGKIAATAPRSFVYHRACHIIGVGEPDSVMEFFKTVPNLIPSAVIEQCCGSAGSFELKKENAEASAKISSALKKELEKADAKLVVSACGLCRRKIRALDFEAKSPVEIIMEAGGHK